MTSKISSFNIMKEDIRRLSWLAALSCLGSFLSLPATFLMAIQQFYSHLEVMPDLQSRAMLEAFRVYFNRPAMGCQGIVVFLVAILAAVFGFRYLYSRKMVDLYHSVPVKRSRMFLLHYLNGFLLWFVPFAAAMLCTLFMGFFQLKDPLLFGEFAAIAGKAALLFVSAFLIVYHLCLVAVMISGNAGNAILSALIAGLAAAVIYWLFSLLFSYCMDTYLEFPFAMESLLWASPLAAGAGLLSSMPKGSDFLSSPVFLAGTVLLAAANFAAAWKLYLLRPSELAESGIKNRFLQHFLRITASYTAGLVGACFFIMLLGSQDGGGWAVFGALLGSLLAFGILNIIFNMNFRAFFTHRLQMGAMAAAAVLTLLALNYDLIGYNTRIPEREDIVSASIEMASLSDESRYFHVTESGEVKRAMESPDWSYTNQDVIWQVMKELSSRTEDEDVTVYRKGLRISVTLANGSIFTRAYSISDQDRELLRPIVESPDYQAAAYQFSAGSLPDPVCLDISDSQGNQTRRLTDAEDIREISLAYQTDFQNHSAFEDLAEQISVGQLRLRYGGQNNYSDSFYLSIPETFENTLRAVNERFPQMLIDRDAIAVTTLDLTASLYPYMPREGLYSYFGLDGYPDYLEYSRELEEKQSAVSDTAAAETAESLMYAGNTDNLYRLKVSDPESLAELLPLLHFGELRTTFFSQQQYCYAGKALTEGGDWIDCFVLRGTLPVEWIDKLEKTEMGKSS